jgi:hypothetical protein
MTLLFVLHFPFLVVLAAALGWLVYLARVTDHD